MTPFWYLVSGLIVSGIVERIKCAKLLPLQSLHGNTDFPQNGFRQSADSRPQYRGGNLGIEILDASKDIIAKVWGVTAAMHDHVIDAFGSSILKPVGNAVFVQLLQEAAAFVFQQVRQVVLGNLLYHFPGKAIHEVREPAAFLELEPLPKCLHNGILLTGLHVPKGNYSALPAVGVRYIEDIADTVREVRVPEQGNSTGSSIYPAPQPIPHANLGAGGSVWALGMDQHLFPEAVLVILSGSSQKRGVVSGIGYDFQRLGGKQLG